MVVTAVGEEFSALADDDVIGAAPARDELDALLDLALEVAVAQVAGDEVCRARSMAW
ncbi:hypothetical protein ACF1HJ_33710 [Streptomyces sp. NPDC013978]|uniref:hypothetical protein n=1 Tax=Streptomyces sp. NPDC013978 TaxID=3364869 RepID=UPI0036F61492